MAYLDKFQTLKVINPKMATPSTESNSGSPLTMHSHRHMQIASSESSRSTSRSPVVRRNRPPTYNRIGNDGISVLIKCYEDGRTVNESAEIAGINKNTAKSIIKQYNKNGGMLMEKRRGGPRNVKLSAVSLNKIDQIIEENASITLKGNRDKILEFEHVDLSVSSIRNGLNKLRIISKYVALDVNR